MGRSGLFLLPARRRQIPALGNNRFELKRMNGQQALTAILQAGGHLMDESVALQIIEFVAAAVKSGATRLLSEDLNPGQKIAGLRIENPFAAVP